MAAAPAGKPNGELVPGAATAQLVERLPVVVTLSAKVQSVMAAMSMYWSSQNRPPVGAEHFVVQPPVRVVAHAVLHVMFA
jgi:hypothetical protein